MQMHVQLLQKKVQTGIVLYLRLNPMLQNSYVTKLLTDIYPLCLREVKMTATTDCDGVSLCFSLGL